MSEQLAARSRLSLAAGLLAGLVCAGAAPTLAQGNPPNFAGTNVGWVAVGTDWTAKPD
jgi:hypothetical protein